MIIAKQTIDAQPAVVAELFNRWRDVLYSRVDFTHPDSEFHSYGHTERVLLHALIVGYDIFGHDSEALDILAHAALFHDTRRYDDYLDTGHGARGAVHYKEFCDANPDMTFHPESQYLMRFHDLDDSIGNGAIARDFPDADRCQRVLQLYAIFKDADALDRWRLGSKGLDPKFLRTDKARQSVDFARRLVEQTIDLVELDLIDRRVSALMSGRMLLIVDPQIDFITGSLPVPGAEDAMNRLAEYILARDGQYSVNLVTADWHPANHMSFAANGGEWPAHCVADSDGAGIWPAVRDALRASIAETILLRKGCDADREEYSIFNDVNAAQRIEDVVNMLKISKIDVCGLAGDVCVLSTLRDAMKAFPDVEIRVLAPLCPSIDGGLALADFASDHGIDTSMQ